MRGERGGAPHRGRALLPLRRADADRSGPRPTAPSRCPASTRWRAAGRAASSTSGRGCGTSTWPTAIPITTRATRSRRPAFRSRVARARPRGPLGARLAARIRIAARGGRGAPHARARRAPVPPHQVGLPAVARAGPLSRRGLRLGRRARSRAGLGWQVAGVEVDEAAAGKARRFSPRVHAGDLLAAPFAAGEFDCVTAFHVLEHVPDPVGAVRRMLGWLAPGGLLVIEVPNAGGLGARLFGRAWSGSSCRGISRTSRRRRWARPSRGRGAWSCGAGTRRSRGTTSGAWATGCAIAGSGGWRGSPSGGRCTAC